MRLIPAKRWFRSVTTLAAISVASMAGCDETAGTVEPGLSESNAPLTDLDALLEGAPDRDKLPDEPKSDQTFPATFDLVELQSPIRNQASRGVCSIFSTVALMEHLYIKEGTIKNPDFSEQFLQWSAKAEVKAFQDTGGSNANSNLEAINRFGIVTEAVSPYEGRGWNSTNDPLCTGDKQPFTCYTNGDPSATAKAATRYKLPAGRWVSSRVNSIKAFMYNNKQAVVAGMTFYYQSWNHGGSPLKVSSDYSREGYVLFPNEADIKASEEKRAGHSILLVGWDDTLEVQSVDDKGVGVVDAAGKPVMEKGFFVFKNSWGDSGTFGSKNKFGHGYGYLSMKYTEKYANVMGANVPSVNLGPETCSDKIDNNYDGLVDCEETTACAKDAACTTASRTFKSSPNATIPDNSPAGYTSTTQVDAVGFATSVYVDVVVNHSFVRDLKLVLKTPSGREVVLYERTLPSGKNLIRRFNVAALVGEDVKGGWSLTVSDLSKGDTGRLTSWELGLGLPAGTPVEDCSDGKDNTGNGKSDCQDPACVAFSACLANNPGELSGLNVTAKPIPDNSTTGVRSEIALTGPGLVDGVDIDVEITHPYRGDLTVKLIHPDGTIAVLTDRKGGSERDINETFTTNAFNGKKAAGKWTLWVLDGFAGDVGTLKAWIAAVGTK